MGSCKHLGPAGFLQLTEVDAPVNETSRLGQTSVVGGNHNAVRCVDRFEDLSVACHHGQQRIDEATPVFLHNHPFYMFTVATDDVVTGA